MDLCPGNFLETCNWKLPQTLSDSDWIFYPYNVCLSANGISVDFARRNKMILWNRCYAAVHGVMLTLVRYSLWRRESLLGVFGDAEKQVVGDVNAEKVHFLYTVYFSRIDIWLSACNIKLENKWISACGMYELKCTHTALLMWHIHVEDRFKQFMWLDRRKLMSMWHLGKCRNIDVCSLKKSIFEEDFCMWLVCWHSNSTKAAFRSHLMLTINTALSVPPTPWTAKLIMCDLVLLHLPVCQRICWDLAPWFQHYPSMVWYLAWGHLALTMDFEPVGDIFVFGCK